MKICYVDCNFRSDARLIIQQASDILEEYIEEGLALSLRQLYYQFVSRGLLPNDVKSYAKLGNVISDARLAGLIDWDSIEDRGRNLEGPQHWHSPESIIEACARGYAIDKWDDQDHYVEVWIEKQALEAIVEQAVEHLDVNYFSCKGYVSQSEMWRASERFRDKLGDGKRCTIIHLGDHDPSGIDMSRDIEDRLNTVFKLSEDDEEGVGVTINRIALNMDQIKKYNPPPNPAKLTDSRAVEYIARFGNSSWELDALEPKVLRSLIQKAVRSCMDEELFEQALARESAEREELLLAARSWDDVVAFLKDKKPKKGKKN